MDADEVRDTQRRTWDALSSSWDRWDHVITTHLEPVGAAMIGGLALADGHHHLDIASGSGEPGLTVAGRLPAGRVVLSDLSAQMLQVAARRADERGLGQVETAVCSADDLPFEDGAFDSVTARFGYMFFPDLDAATAEMVRVLRRGGRLSAAVWAAPEHNPWLTLVTAAVGQETELPAPPPGAPGVFRCSDAGLLPSLYGRAGLTDVHESDVPVELAAPTAEECWDVLSQYVAPAAGALALLDDAGRDRVRSSVIADLERFRDGDGYRVPGLARVAVGTR